MTWKPRFCLLFIIYHFCNNKYHNKYASLRQDLSAHRLFQATLSTLLQAAVSDQDKQGPSDLVILYVLKRKSERKVGNGSYIEHVMRRVHHQKTRRRHFDALAIAWDDLLEVARNNLFLYTQMQIDSFCSFLGLDLSKSLN